jgi:hypothetical protein
MDTRRRVAGNKRTERGHDVKKMHMQRIFLGVYYIHIIIVHTTKDTELQLDAAHHSFRIKLHIRIFCMDGTTLSWVSWA